jgi:membrane protein required for colicin V production
MNVLDIVLIILLIVSAIGGLASGLIKSIFSLAGVIVGVTLAGRFYPALAGGLTFISNPTIANIAAFAIIFIIIMIIASILGGLFTKLVSAILLGWLNRLGGAVFGVIMGAIFIAAILAVWAKMGGANSIITESKIALFLLDRFPLILALLPQEFNSIRQFFQ